MEDRERKILEWVGFATNTYTTTGIIMTFNEVIYPDGKHHQEYPPIDPNFIAGYVLPALREQEYTIEIDIDPSCTGRTSVAIIKEEWHHGGLTVNEMYHVENPDPLEAFLQALEKLIDGKQGTGV